MEQGNWQPIRGLSHRDSCVWWPEAGSEKSKGRSCRCNGLRAGEGQRTHDPEVPAHIP